MVVRWVGTVGVSRWLRFRLLSSSEIHAEQKRWTKHGCSLWQCSGSRALCNKTRVSVHASSPGSSQWRHRATASAEMALPTQTETGIPVEIGIGRKVIIGQVALQGRRDEMEDDVVVIMDAPLGFTFAAVFDGHGGFSSAKYLRNELYKVSLEYLEGGKLLESEQVEALDIAFNRAFLEADNRLLSWLETSSDEEKESGSTATCMFLGKDSITVASVGDSRAVLCQAGKAVSLSEDHRPYGNSKMSLAEVQRIKQEGGWVSNGRVCGMLAVSRAFGDVGFKLQKKQLVAAGVKNRHWTERFASRLNLDGSWVVASPSVFQMKLDESSEFVVLASDGLWDYFKSSEAVQFLRKQLRMHGDPQRACEAIAQATLDRNGEDNISIIVIDFGKIYQGTGSSDSGDFKSKIFNGWW